MRLYWSACVIFALVFVSSASVSAQTLQFPVQGNWLVFQGPPCPAYGPPNHHCNTPNQQFAYDLVPAGGSCLGAPILSPTSGTVIEALDGYPDYPQFGQHIAGNHVVIQRSPNEYILMAHLAQGSVNVVTGSAVAIGQLIGRCGFNGNSNTPHLHIHMQSGPSIMHFGTPGLPMHFSNVGVLGPAGCTALNGQLLARGMTTC